jgi:ABC-2 type transport system ATP-binding protein
MTTIDVRSVSRRYGDTLAVDDVSFTVASGTVTGLLGPNGSGKSTLLRRILGIDAGPGTALFDGRPYVALDEPATLAGAVLDASGIHPGLRARRHLRAVAAALRVPARRADELLELVDLTHAGAVRARALSLGMRQRLAVATALVGSPSVLVLDEPTNGLDPHGVRWLGRFLRGFADRGGTVLMSSHLLSEVEHVADRVEVIAQGRLVASGTCAEIVRSVAPAVVVARSTEPAALRDALVARGAAVTLDGAELRVRGLGVADVAAVAKAAPGLLLALSTDEGSLESAYLTIAGAR